MKVPGLCSSVMKPWFAFSLFLVLPQLILAQLVKINCIDPKVIVVPVQPGETEEIHYKDHDEHTFWYRIEAKTNCQLSYHISGLQPSASFTVEFYEYEGASFCKQLVKEQLEALSTSLAYSTRVKKGRKYYLGVNIAAPNCGHEVTFSDEKQQMSVRTTLIGSECADREDYRREMPVVNVEEKQTMANRLQMEGRVKNRLTDGSINADLTLLTEGGEALNAIAYRLKGYKIEVDKGIPYRVKIKALGYLPLDTTITMKRSGSVDFTLMPVASGGKFVVENIYFYPNAYACKPESEAALEALTAYMLENGKLRIEIQGHTNGNKDIRKSKDNETLGEEWNFEGSARELSRLRAEKLKSYLVQHGVAENRIITAGKGGDEMIVPEPKDMEEAAKNIRVEIRILPD